VHAWATLKLPTGSWARTLELQIQVNNLFNRLYASHGEGDEFFPAAERNIFASLRFGL
jgi:outer membrane receptor protein involved in Fe transport